MRSGKDRKQERRNHWNPFYPGRSWESLDDVLRTIWIKTFTGSKHRSRKIRRGYAVGLKGDVVRFMGMEGAEGSPPGTKP